MARQPGTPINDATARYVYTAAQALAEGMSTADAGRHLRATYGLEDPQEILGYVRQGKLSLNLAEAYLSGDAAAVNAARAALPPGIGNEYVLTVKVRLQDRPAQTPGGDEEEDWRTVRIIVQPGMTLDDVQEALQEQYRDIESEYDSKILDYLGLSALAV